MKYKARPRHYLLILALLVLSASGVAPVLAEADGPDFFQVRDVAPDDVLNIRASNDWRSDKIGEIPYDGRCVRNLGCSGGLTLQEFTDLSTAEQERIKKERPRWCQIEYQEQTGWVAGRYLRENEGLCN